MGIYYPDSDEDIQASIAAMMNSIDTAVGALNTATSAVDTPDGVSIYASSMNAPHAATVQVDFTGGFIEYDTGGYWNAGTPTRYTLDPGWWFVTARAACSPAAGSVEAFDLVIRSNNFALVDEHQVSNTGGNGEVMVGGLYCKPDATDYLWMEMIFVGTAGGNSTIPVPVMTAVRIGDL